MRVVGFRVRGGDRPHGCAEMLKKRCAAHSNCKTVLSRGTDGAADSVCIASDALARLNHAPRWSSRIRTNGGSTSGMFKGSLSLSVALMGWATGRRSMRQTDIAIVGGGLAGSTVAAMMGRAGIPAVLIDPHDAYP